MGSAMLDLYAEREDLLRAAKMLRTSLRKLQTVMGHDSDCFCDTCAALVATVFVDELR